MKQLKLSDDFEAHQSQQHFPPTHAWHAWWKLHGSKKYHINCSVQMNYMSDK